MTTHLRRLLLAPALIAVPLALLAILALRSPKAGGPAPSGTAILRWPGGEQKVVVSRDWLEEGVELEEQCAYDARGAEIGCGQLRAGKPWSGVFADWAGPPGEPQRAGELSALRRYREGRRHGAWQSFHLDGKLAVELMYEDDRLLSRQLFAPDGTPRALPGAPAPGLEAIPPARRSKRP